MTYDGWTKLPEGADLLAMFTKGETVETISTYRFSAEGLEPEIVNDQWFRVVETEKA